MVSRELTLATILVLTAYSLSVGGAQAQPSPPATFFGAVKVDGQVVSDGTPVLAFVNGKQCGESSREPGQKGTWTLDQDATDLGVHAGDSVYIMEVVSDGQTPGCGTEGAIVTFQVAGQSAHETGTWRAGFNSLNLAVGETPAPTTTAQGQASDTPQAAPGQAASSSGDFPWWAAATGGAGVAVILVGLVAAVWWQRAEPRRQT